MPFWSRGQKGVALMRFGGGDGAACLVRAVRMWERTCGLELLGSVASILVVVDCLVLRLGMRRSVASPLVRNCWHEILIRIVLARDLLQEICCVWLRLVP